MKALLSQQEDLGTGYGEGSLLCREICKEYCSETHLGAEGTTW